MGRKRWFHRFGSLPGGGRRVMGINRRNAEYVYRWNPRRHFPLADDKLLTKRVLTGAGVPVPQTIGFVRGFFEIARATRWLCETGDGVIKPSRGKGGGGVMVLRGVEPSQRARLERELKLHFTGILSGVYSAGVGDVALIEERLKPHPYLAKLWGDDVVDIRVIAHRGEAVMAMIRVATLVSEGRSNLHAGGLGVAVDLANGCTRGGFWKGRPVDTHPDTGGRLSGIEVPDWPQIVEIARITAAQMPLGYLGVDIALDGERGPFVLEVNVRPGLEIQNVNACGLVAAIEERLS